MIHLKSTRVCLIEEVLGLFG